MIKQFSLWFRYLRRACFRCLQWAGRLFSSRRRLPRQTIRELQALSAYRGPGCSVDSPANSQPKSEGQRYRQSASSAHPQQTSVRDEFITYSVPREEIVRQLNSVLDADSVKESACSVDGDVSTYRYRFPHKADAVIDPADMAYLAECHGHHKEAERLYYQSIRIRTQKLGAQHLEVAIVTSDLASLYCSLKRYVEAEPLLIQALSIQQQVAPEQVETGNSLYQLAKLYQHVERYSEADQLFQNALTIFRQTLGADHPKTQAVYTDLMKMVVTAIEVGKFAELNAGLPPLDLDALSEKDSWAQSKWE